VARLIRRIVILLILLALAAAALMFGRDWVRRHPQDVPWTELRLSDPIGMFTQAKLASLADQPAQCQSLLLAAGARHEPAPPRSDGPDCGYTNGMRLFAASDEAEFRPRGIVTSCPVAAALVIFERQVAQPAAMRHFGSRIAAIDHAGSYACRRRYGRAEGRFSEHATADAIDITGFRLADGRVVSVLRDWRDDGPKGAFLRDVRDGACRLFATTLSPDYNDAHTDHLHFDQAQRRTIGGGLCR